MALLSAHFRDTRRDSPLTTTMEVGLSIGANIGDRFENVRLAKKKIGGLAGVEIVAESPVYETDPVGVPSEFESKRFLNAVLVVATACSLSDLAGRLRAIETEMGRARSLERNMPRPIDIDIIYADDLCVSDAGLTVPHPRWSERRFVAQPLADVRPELIIPGETRTVRQALMSLPESPSARLFSRRW